MIFVTVGTHTAPFDRLVTAADRYAEVSREEVIVQRGASTYVPRHAPSFPFCDAAAMAEHIQSARVVVSHAADTVFEALRASRPVVAVPRRREFGEHLDDHQVDFAHALADAGLAIVLEDPEDIARSIQRAVDVGPAPAPEEPRLVLELKRVIDQWFPLR